jgi:zinc transporter ZupT
MPRTHIAVLLLSLLSIVTTSIGVLFAVVIRENARLIAIGLGFSTGIMIAVSITDLIPTAITDTGLQETILTGALGACVLWLANVLIPHIQLMLVLI